MDIIDGDQKEIELNRAVSTVAEDIRLLLQHLIYPKTKRRERSIHRYAKKSVLAALKTNLELFHENPQLLDPHLQHIVNQISSVYLELSILDVPAPRTSRILPLSTGLGRLIYQLCLVRGEKVIIRLLPNETKHLEPLLSVLEALQAESKAWEERFVLLLWISQLLLAPFDLSTISSNVTISNLSANTLQDSGLVLPAEACSITCRILPICIPFLTGPTREKVAAAKLLARLCLRPDMRRIGLLQCVLAWTIRNIESLESAQQGALHRGLGLLQFLAYFLSLGSVHEVSESNLLDIYRCIQLLQNSDKYDFLRKTANAQNLIIKLTRNVVKKSLNANMASLDSDSMLSEFIDQLLHFVEHSDSLVRLAASKSLSIVTQFLEPEMAHEIIQAIVDLMLENLVETGMQTDYSFIDPLRWHGLTLTLSQLLYRRAVPPDCLQEILQILILALNFEQRSVTGASVGTNVRDAANFGIWAIARRYRTKELLDMPIHKFQSQKCHSSATSIIQVLATELVKTACFDPAGNVRRGSSAALQELIGRHPNSVVEGINLTQTVDYQVVSLMRNSMVEAATAAAKLSPMYWWAVYDSLFGWRGAAAHDRSTRELLSDTIFQLLKNLEIGTHSLSDICQKAREPQTSPEFRVGLTYLGIGTLRRISEEVKLGSGTDNIKLAEVYHNTLQVLPDVDTINRMRSLIARMLAVTNLLLIYEISLLHSASSLNSNVSREILNHVDWCLRRMEEEDLEHLLSYNKQVFAPWSTQTETQKAMETWKSEVGFATLTNPKKIPPGIMLALGCGSQWAPRLQSEIIRLLCLRCTPALDVDSRVTALRSLGLAIPESATPNENWAEQLSYIIQALKTAFKDHTVNQKGDVGSNVRIAALQVLELLKTSSLMTREQEQDLIAHWTPLALDSLERVRESAWSLSYEMIGFPQVWISEKVQSLVEGVTSDEYYFAWLRRLETPLSEYEKGRIVEGFCISSSSGSEATVRNSRMALSQYLDDSEHAILFIGLCQQVLEENLKNDRVAIPLLNTLAFAGDMGIFKEPRHNSAIKWKRLLSFVQKAHYQSASIGKILSALEVYRGLADVDDIRSLVCVKLKSMLLHVYPRIRVGAATVLVALLKDSETKNQILSEDWSKKIDQVKNFQQSLIIV